MNASDSSETARSDRSFSRSRRLLSAGDYRAVFDDVRFKAGQSEFVLLARPSSTEHSRLGLAIARKHIRRAVNRNLMKRLAREVFRMLPPAEPALDIVLLSRPAAAHSDRASLRAGLLRQFRLLQQRARHA
jgi:ribonuclease P protein component